MTTITEKKHSLGFLLLLAVCVTASLLLAAPAWGQNVQVDLTSTCGGGSCFNTPGIFTTGTTFEGTNGMDAGFNCTITGQSNCPDAYSANQLGLPSAAPFTLTPPSLNVPFTFGPVNTANCGSTGTACLLDTISLPGAGATISLPSGQQKVYSTLILLGTAVNGSHTGKVTVTYGDSTTDVFSQTFSDWCGFASGTANGVVTESIAVGPMHRINADGTLNGASCNLYSYTYSVNFNKVVTGITLANTDGTAWTYVLAATLKPPTYTVDAGTANPTSIKAGSPSTATITVNPQPGYVGDITLSCSISPQFLPSDKDVVPPSCSLSPTSVTVSAGSPPPTTALTFTAAAPPKMSGLLLRSPSMLWALCLPIPGLALIGFGPGKERRRKLRGVLLFGLLLAAAIVIPGCGVNYIHLGNVGTPPGPYTITVTGIDANGLSQASNPPGTTNQVVVTVTP